MTLLCSGSLAFDRLMTHSCPFTDNLLADKLDFLNVCFVVDKARRVFGGTAGNIAYNLGLLGEKPLVVTSVGDDGDGRDYLDRLAGQGFPLEGIAIQPGFQTAGCTIITDRNNNQLTFFHPGAMGVPSGFDPAGLTPPYEQHLAIVSPGGPEEMKSLCVAYRNLGIRFIFDPGQQIPMFSKDELLDMLEGSFIFCCNEYEFELVKKITDLSTDDLFRHTEVVIVTKGEAGSELLVPGRGSQHIPSVPPRQVVNPTGAGDAYRAGLMKGLTNKEHLITACRLGATVASFCVEVAGTQEQVFSPVEVMARHASAFKEQVNLL